MIKVYLILIVLLLLFILGFNKISERFDVYDTCTNQGYPYQWCLNAPYEINTCSCPPGQKLYKRYGRCYCQTYAT